MTMPEMDPQSAAVIEQLRREGWVVRVRRKTYSNRAHQRMRGAMTMRIKFSILAGLLVALSAGLRYSGQHVWIDGVLAVTALIGIALIVIAMPTDSRARRP